MRYYDTERHPGGFDEICREAEAMTDKNKRSVWHGERQGKPVLVFLAAAVVALGIAYASVSLLSDTGWDNLEIVRMFQKHFMAREGAGK